MTITNSSILPTTKTENNHNELPYSIETAAQVENNYSESSYSIEIPPETSAQVENNHNRSPYSFEIPPETSTHVENNHNRSPYSIEIPAQVENNHHESSYSIEIPPETTAKVGNIEETNDKPSNFFHNFCICMIIYAKKFYGLHEERPKRLPWEEYLWSFIGSIIGIAAVAFFHFRLLEQHQLLFLIGSFGATAVIVFGTPRSPLAQPRNLIGGHVISAIIGCVVRVAIDRFEHSIACALAVALSIAAMQFTETLHPPGGATALIAVTTRPALPWAHFLFILMPVLTGACVMLIVALIINNMAPKRTYPCFWF